ncbi:putative peroxiredoxin [Salinivirga cyanobacteriivorans]|uniref:Putative peroxiredoxin n=1 Tax=Salinivirga cyanobacteriivorans TaxID=1307839 RepID=A0A0S2I3Y5_9BACT|nr:DsrE family protein [Salinivirga cyanobacteriivorans]ALO17176.1 putative peroxiredoxin [Salinivirga cyanobacteriivorans]
MNRILLTLVAILVMISASCVQNNSDEPANKQTTKIEKKTDGLFVHISTNEARKVLMGLSIALKMQEGKDVIVFVDAQAINAIVKGGDEYEMEGYEGSSSGMIQKLVKKGVAVMACPMCLKSYGKTDADLLDGIQIAQKEQFFGFTEGRILTLDY